MAQPFWLAEFILRDGGWISVQVLNEFANVPRNKRGRAWSEVRDLVAIIRGLCSVVPLTEDVRGRGLELCQRNNFSIYDGMIVSAALQAGCSTLYSEDMHDGFAMEGLSIVNPFV